MIYLWFLIHTLRNNDSHSEYTGTIYLNNNWNENYGGYFNYKEQKTNEIKTVIHNII